eukprot:scaffold13273_cov81-Isochrysis_galbana.AAC.2
MSPFTIHPTHPPASERSRPAVLFCKPNGCTPFAPARRPAPRYRPAPGLHTPAPSLDVPELSPFPFVCPTPPLPTPPPRFPRPAPPTPPTFVFRDLPIRRGVDQPIANHGQHARHGEVPERRLGQVEDQKRHGDGDDYFDVCVLVRGGIQLEPPYREKAERRAEQLGEAGGWAGWGGVNADPKCACLCAPRSP